MKNPIDEIKKTIQSTKFFSGRTLIVLSLFSWLMSLLISTELLRDFLSTLGWLFLTVGVGWVTADIKFTVFGITIYPSPWVTGAMTASFLFQPWTNDPRPAVISWAPISAVIAILPKFFKHGYRLFNLTEPDPKKFAGDRQESILLLLFSTILSCWLQFHFVLQDWLQQYPSLLADDFRRSAFVVKVEPETAPPIRGATLLNLIETLLEQELEQLSWAEVERWLLNAPNEMPALKAAALQKIPQTQEDDLWLVQAQVLQGNPGYRLRLVARWLGPSSRPNGYYVQKNCDVTEVATQPVPTAPRTPTPLVSQVTCEPTSGLIWIQ